MMPCLTGEPVESVKDRSDVLTEPGVGERAGS